MGRLVWDRQLALMALVEKTPMSTVTLADAPQSLSADSVLPPSVSSNSVMMGLCCVHHGHQFEEFFLAATGFAVTRKATFGSSGG